MTEVEGLVRQAEKVKRQWRKPSAKKGLTNHSWQELLDGGSYPKLRIGKL